MRTKNQAIEHKLGENSGINKVKKINKNKKELHRRKRTIFRRPI